MSSPSNSRGHRAVMRHVAAASLLALAAAPAMALSVTLCAEPYAQDLPGAPATPMWGYRQITGASGESACGTPSASDPHAPVITVPAGDTTLAVTLINRLTVPTSIVISGQSLPSDGGAPVSAVDLVGASCDPTAGTAAERAACRVRSFTGETAPAGTRTYTFTNLRPGTYLYQSGTHPQVQVQMGLFGMVRQDATVTGSAGRLLFANANSAFDADVPVVFSEIDVAQHNLIASTLGSADPTTWKAGNNSTLNYAPNFFLVNGKVFDGAGATDLPVSAGAGARVVLRMANAGLQSRTLMLSKGTVKVMTEDGRPFPAPLEHSTVLLTAGKTHDAMLAAPAVAVGATDRSLALFDRRGGADGGLITRVAITGAAATNKAPLVNAGADLYLPVNGATAFPVSASLSGVVTDDGLNQPLTIGWSVVSGPGTVAFGNAAAAATSASLSAPGVYTLRLTANDGEFTVTDDVVVGTNNAPTVSAGPSQTLTVNNAVLAGSASDDGVPGPLTTTWSLVSGPAGATASFANAASPATTVTLSALGTYTLRLTANDGQQSSSSDTVVTVNAGKHIGDLDITASRLIASSWNATVTVRVENALQQPVAGATVTGAWSAGVGLGSSCLTGASGTCQIFRGFIPNTPGSVTFTVTNVTGANGQGAYVAANNRDPDTGAQASNGTTITVAAP